MDTKSNISTAQREYYKRPADERFDTLEAMLTSAQYDRDHSRPVTYNLRDLTAQPIDTGVILSSPKGSATLTPWSYGQLCRTIGAPSAYVRTLPPELQAQAINHGLHEAAEPGETAKLLVRANGSAPVIRACTSETYGRAWDAEILAAVGRHFGDGVQSAGGTWQTPPAWPGSQPSGQYRGDRDSFVIRVDGGSIVTDPRAQQGKPGGGLYRGIMVRNSEVGACSVSMQCVLFDFICGNHMLWGAVINRTFTRRHVGENVTRDTIGEVLQIARQFNQRSASEDERIIQTLVDHELAHTRAAVIDELKKLKYTQAQATAAYDCAERTEHSPRSFWGIAQGTTRISQESGHQDDRLALDLLAAQVMRLGAKQYATV